MLSTCYARLPLAFPSSFTEPHCSSFHNFLGSLPLLVLTDFRIIFISTPNTSTAVGLASALSF